MFLRARGNQQYEMEDIWGMESLLREKGHPAADTIWPLKSGRNAFGSKTRSNAPFLL